MSSLPARGQDYDTERSEQIRREPPTSDNDIFILQVRAFLEASEDVDIDVETFEDLMQSLPPDFQSEVDPIGELESTDDDTFDEDTNGANRHELTEEMPVLYEIEEQGPSEISLVLTCSTHYDADQQIWTAQEVQQMMHHLKERVRDKLTQYNTVSDAVNLIRSSRRILVLTGAGISVSCGIPDFRSRDGLYASLKNRGQYDLDDPQQMFDINYFRENPAVFYSFASQIYPSNFIPSPCHRFIKLIENKNQNYTQNIDTLETLVGVQRVLQCHGSFATASCLQCRRRVPGSEIEADIMNQKVALCTMCNPAVPTPKKKRGKKKAKGQWDSDDEDESDDPTYPPGIMKPDITFFGEKLTDEFDNSLAEDRERVDLLLVIGTSLKVSPVAETLSNTAVKIILLGNADDIVQYLCEALGWELPPPGPAAPSHKLNANPRSIHETSGSNDKSQGVSKVREPERVGDSHVWLFDGAEGGRWLEDLKREVAAQTPPSLTPLVVDSGANTRLPSPSPVAAADPVYRKREFVDVNGEERMSKKARP
ncbi:hypothetical protein C0995_002076 [Termitomyces sp. Mi166|nr:hypothetical protein C0995_002076 [Termitomyces sp. Mi166\